MRPERLLRWLTYQRVPVRGMRILQPGTELAVLLSYAMFYVAASWGVALLITRWPRPLWGSVDFTTDLWYVLLFKIALLLVLPLVWFAQRGYGVRDLLPGWHLRVRTAASILLALLAGFSLNLNRLALIGEALGGFPAGEQVVRVGLGALLPLFTAAIPEEVVFRGVLQTRVERLWGRLAAILVTAILFTAWHLPSRYLLADGVEGTAGDFGSVVLGTGIPVFLVALVFGVCWDRYRSLLPLIAAHWGIDILPGIASVAGAAY